MDIQVTAVVPPHQRPAMQPVADKLIDTGLAILGIILAVIVVVMVSELIRIVFGRK